MQIVGLNSGGSHHRPEARPAGERLRTASRGRLFSLSTIGASSKLPTMLWSHVPNINNPDNKNDNNNNSNDK